MDFALMFNVIEGGESVPIKWGKENLQPDRAIIVLDEASLSIYLWEGIKLGLIARRTALRQAESLKGHGYTIGKSIIGRDIKAIKELDQRKIGKDPETDKINGDLQKLLNKNYKELENFIVTFESMEIEAPKEVSKIKADTVKQPEVKVKADTAKQPEIKVKPLPQTTAPIAQKKETAIASEYASEGPAKPKDKVIPPSKAPEALKAKESQVDSNLIEAKKSFLILSVLDHYSDIWLSKKKDGSIAIEMIDGPVCEFNVKGTDISYTANSFSGVNPEVKTAILKKFQELLKLL